MVPQTLGYSRRLRGRGKLRGALLYLHCHVWDTQPVGSCRVTGAQLGALWRPREAGWGQFKREGYMYTCPWWLSGKESTCQCRRQGFNPWFQKIPWRGKWQSIPVFLPGEPHGQRSLACYSQWVYKELDMTQWQNTHTQLIHFAVQQKLT